MKRCAGRGASSAGNAELPVQIQQTGAKAVAIALHILPRELVGDDRRLWKILVSDDVAAVVVGVQNVNDRLVGPPLDLFLPQAGEIPDDAAESRDEPLYDLQWGKEAQNVPEAHEVTRGQFARFVRETGYETEWTVTDGVRDLAARFRGEGGITETPTF